MLCALIMAGGRGTRFWPLSTEDKPKQFLKLINEDTMIQATVKRLENLIPIERIFVVTGKKYISLLKEQLPNLPERNIIIEPVGRNTAPCIGLSAFHIRKFYQDATIAVLPSDHLITDEKNFLEVLNSANMFVDKNKNAIVTIGMKPNRPETGYGYINYDSIDCTLDGCEIRKVKRFVEKPDLEKAKEYLKDGQYLWNGGMFIWKAENILKLTSMYMENTYRVLSEIAATNEEEYDKVLEEKYTDVENISVDYGIMEKADSIYVIPSDFGWDDVGSWSSIERYRNKDFAGNICVGDVNVLNGNNNLIISSEKKIVISDVDNIFVVECDGNIYITTKAKLDEIKDLKLKIDGDAV